MNYVSICSGIEAATCAWHPLGWHPLAFSEIEPFPCAVLKHHYPQVPNLGDLTKYHDWNFTDRVDLIVGGTPCQAFSVAGLRRGLADPRGNLTLTFLGLVDRVRPEWMVWENVPGVLSDRSGAFGAFLGGLGQLGYGWAYRILDAQYFGVAQRRRRVFVVANARSWQRAAAVLFERESLCGHPAPSRETRQGVAGTLSARTGLSSGVQDASSGHMIAADVAPTLNAQFGAKQGLENQHIDGGGGLFVAHALRASHDASEDGTGRGVPLVAHSFPWQVGGTMGCGVSTEQCGTLVKNQIQAVKFGQAVRRLTPRECERLQGFPDDYTAIPWRGRTAENCPDWPRYKALGNSMAVPVMAWIGRNIALVQNSLLMGAGND